MFTKKQRPGHQQAYTILESLIVLGLLVILALVGTAVYLHEKETGQPTIGTTSELLQPAPDQLAEDSPPSALETENEE